MWSALLLATFQTPSLSYWITKVDITPPELLPLGGYTARHGVTMTGVGDRLFARGLILKQGKKKIALVSCEMLTMPESLYREVRARVPMDTQIFLAATHTHSAPDSQMLNDRMTFQIPGIASYRPRWLQWYADEIVKAFGTSGRGTPLYSVLAKVAHPDANRGRRKFAEPDQTYTELDAQGAALPGPPRPSDRSLRSYRPPAAVPLLAEYAAHGTLFAETENRTRGDWPGVLGARLDAPILVGAIGDVSPKAVGDSPQQRAESLVSTLLRAPPMVLPGWTAGQPIAYVRAAIPLDTRSPHPSFSKSYGVPDPLAKVLVQKFAPDHAEVTAIRIGSVAIVGVPGEPTSHLGREIRDYGRILGFNSVLVVSHVNGWMGYILGAEDYDRGGYEATLSFNGREEGDKVVEAAEESLRELALNKVK